MRLNSDNLIFHIILAIPVLLFILLIVLDFIKRTWLKLLTGVIATIIVTPLLYSGLTSLFFSLWNREPKRAFDQVSWLNEPHIRFQMIDDLIDDEILPGKDSFQVKELLGTAPYRYDGLNYWIYPMGTGGAGLGFAHHQLRIEFKGSKVIKVEHGEVLD